MTQQEAINAVLNLARNEIGYHEKSSNSQLDSKTANSGGGNYTKYARDLDSLGNFYNGPKNGYAWCDVFVDWLFYKCFGKETAMKMLCQPLNSAGAGCAYSASYYQQANQWTRSPQPGDQIFFTYGHTGIVETVSGNQITTIEGNSSDQVSRRSYNKSNGQIQGYGRPRWQYADSISDIDLPSIPITPSTTTTTILRRGDTGAQVKKLQNDLIHLGYTCGPDGADGDFGENTYKAVYKFQQDHNLLADGEAGPDTLAAIKKALGPYSKPSTSQTTLKTGTIIEFLGGKHYATANAATGSDATPGKARITIVKDTAKHPYHLIKTLGSTSNVFGWVDKDTIKEE